MNTAEPFDANAFHEFERAGWEGASAFYVDAFAGLTRQTATDLLDAVGAGPGIRLLDVATGPGFIAAAAAARGAEVVGIDFSPAMIATATQTHPGVAFREDDAEALAFESGRFDAVVMNFGLLHLARPEAALSEARRVLRRGGRYAFTIWAPPERAVGFGMVLRAVNALGQSQVPLPEGPPFFRFSDRDECTRALEASGFGDVEVRELPLEWRVTSAGAVFDALSRGGVRTAAVLRAQTPEALTAIQGAVRAEVKRYARDGAFVIPMPAVLASATAD
ncbi:MAG TPA: methyltransferase domain-containing protein [Vicinamibacterales bacterium]|jgi:SAM-dependent methyltransferase